MRQPATEIARMLDVSLVQTHHSLEDIKKGVELAKEKGVMAIHDGGKPVRRKLRICKENI